MKIINIHRQRRSVGESIVPDHRNKEGEEEEEKTISDIPNEVLATILEYIFFHQRKTGPRELIKLSLVSKLWCRMTRLVSSSSCSRYLSIYLYISIHIYTYLSLSIYLSITLKHISTIIREC